MRLKQAHADFLAVQRVVRVGTASPRGRLYVVPVCHVVHGGRLYFASEDGAQKIRNLRANPRATIVADDYTEAWDGLRGVMVGGTARLHARGSRWRLARRLLYAKYPQYEAEAALEEGEAVVVEVSPAQVFAWGFA